MFKRIIYILSIGILALLFACAGQSKDESAPTNAMMEESEDAKGVLSETDIIDLPEELSEEQQNAFQLRAIQKLEDFTDYVKLLSEADMDNDLKEHSRELIKQVFIHDSIAVFSPDSNLLSFIEEISAVSSPITFKTNKIEFSNPIAKDSLGSYTGEMKVIWEPLNDTNVNHVQVYLIELTKEFGETNQKTVEIRLGNIY
jgi:hypothetical protein